MAKKKKHRCLDPRQLSKALFAVSTGTYEMNGILEMSRIDISNQVRESHTVNVTIPTDYTSSSNLNSWK